MERWQLIGRYRGHGCIKTGSDVATEVRYDFVAEEKEQKFSGEWHPAGFYRMRGTI